MKCFRVIFSILVFGLLIGCSNPAAPRIEDDPSEGMLEVLRIDQEVRDLFYFDRNAEGKPSNPRDTGIYGDTWGSSMNYAMEFYYRYKDLGEVYFVMVDWPNKAVWYSVDDWFPADYLPGFGFGIEKSANGFWYWRGILRCARITPIAEEPFTAPADYRVDYSRAWNVVFLDGAYYLIDTAWRDYKSVKAYPIKKVSPPDFY